VAKKRKTARGGRLEIRRADSILAEHAPDVPRVSSPGRAAFVTTLFDLGRRGEDLDWRAHEERWVELTDGSSSAPGDSFVIHGTEDEVIVHFFDVQRHAYARHGETPAFPAARKFLRGYKEILAALGVPQGKNGAIAVRNLSQRTNGPINIGRPGQRPTADQERLMRWWCEVNERQRQRDEVAEGRRRSLEATYKYGRGSVDVVPEVSGYVRKHRKIVTRPNKK